MNPNPFGTPNDGDRPSRLDLDRFATGELKGAERAVVQKWIDKNPEGMAWLDGLRSAKKGMPAADIDMLRKRADVPSAASPAAGTPAPLQRMLVEPPAETDDDPNTMPPGIFAHADEDRSTQPFAADRESFPKRASEAAPVLEDDTVTAPGGGDEPPVIQDMRRDATSSSQMPTVMLSRPPEIPEPANRSLMWLFPLLALAAVLTLVAIPVLKSAGTAGPSIPVGVRGGAALTVYTLDGSLVPYKGEKLGAGDVIGFKVDPAGGTSVVLLSIDGTGATTVFHPASGTAAEPLLGTADAHDVELPGTVTLDGAPGPEVFVAVFDKDVVGATAAAEQAYAQGGAKAVEAWADADEHADAVVVDRK